MIMVWLGILICATLGLMLLPFIPCLYEWKKATDAQPLAVNVLDNTIIDYYIRLFRDFITKNFAAILDNYAYNDNFVGGKLAGGIEYDIASEEGIVALSAKEIKQQATKKVILALQTAQLPKQISFYNKIYAKKNLYTGEKNIITSLVAEGEVFLSKETRVKKLIYSGTKMVIAANCQLKGYAKARQSITLDSNAKFQCLYAPRIYFGTCAENLLIAEQAIDVLVSAIPRTVIAEDYVFAENSQAIGHYVVKGTLIVGHACLLKGNLKSHQNIYLGNQVRVIGSLISEQNIEIGDGCVVQGPIVAGGNIRIGKNCIIGTKTTATSLIAKYVQVRSGTIVAGLLLAKVAGLFK